MDKYDVYSSAVYVHEWSVAAPEKFKSINSCFFPLFEATRFRIEVFVPAKCENAGSHRAALPTSLLPTPSVRSLAPSEAASIGFDVRFSWQC